MSASSRLQSNIGKPAGQKRTVEDVSDEELKTILAETAEIKRKKQMYAPPSRTGAAAGGGEGNGQEMRADSRPASQNAPASSSQDCDVGAPVAASVNASALGSSLNLGNSSALGVSSIANASAMDMSRSKIMTLKRFEVNRTAPGQGENYDGHQRPSLGSNSNGQGSSFDMSIVSGDQSNRHGNKGLGSKGIQQGMSRLGINNNQKGGATSSGSRSGLGIPGGQLQRPASPNVSGYMQRPGSPGVNNSLQRPPSPGSGLRRGPSADNRPGSGPNSRAPSPRMPQWKAQSRLLGKPSPEEDEAKQTKQNLELELEDLVNRRRTAMSELQTLREREHELIQQLELTQMETDQMAEKLHTIKQVWADKIEKKKQLKIEKEQQLIKSRERLKEAQEREKTLLHTKSLEDQAIQREALRKEKIEKEFQEAHANETVKMEEIDSWKMKVDEARKYLSALAHKRSLLVLQSKERFNEYMEVKGNIRVFVRIRPLLPNAGPDEKPFAATISSPSAKIILDERSGALQLQSETFLNVNGLQEKTTEWAFQFDKVFGMQASQRIVFDEICQLVKSALDGYKVAIFAYGQTGGGKTYTMEGPPMHSLTQKNFEANAGVIPRAVHLVFQHIKNTSGWTFKCHVSFVEVYNETVRDLLQKGKEVDIQVAGQEVTINCSSLPVKDENDVFNALEKASHLRSYAAHALNDRSSRSHSVFQLKIEGLGPNDHTQKGLLSLVDLAGSERVDKSKVTGDRLKEAQHINKSLSALGDVIQAITEKSGHIPYRNSKLTQLLKESLGGDSKTLMFANIAPTQAAMSESINSLRFAAKVNICKAGQKKKK